MSKALYTDNRIEHIDILRGIAIIFMIMAHIGFGNVFFHIIHAFHMPVFFIISGYFFKHKEKEAYPFSQELKKKAKTLLLPYVVFGLLQYIIKCLTTGFQTNDLLHLFTVNTSSMPIAGAMWFLTALFFASIIYFLLDRYVTKKYLLHIIIIIIAIFGCTCHLFLPITLPWALSQSFAGLGFFHIGHLINKSIDTKPVNTLLSLPWYFNLIMTAIVAATILINPPVDMRLEQYGIIPLFWFNAFFASMALKNYCRYLEKPIGTTPAGTWIRGIGKNSIIYLCLNQLFIHLFMMIFENRIASEWLLRIAVLILTLVILFVTEKIITKTFLKKIIGR